MGHILSHLDQNFRSLWSDVIFGAAGAPSRVLMLGLDAAGKTTVLYKVFNSSLVTGTVILPRVSRVCRTG